MNNSSPPPPPVSSRPKVCMQLSLSAVTWEDCRRWRDTICPHVDTTLHVSPGHKANVCHVCHVCYVGHLLKNIRGNRFSGITIVWHQGWEEEILKVTEVLHFCLCQTVTSKTVTSCGRSSNCSWVSVVTRSDTDTLGQCQALENGELGIFHPHYISSTLRVTQCTMQIVKCKK